MPPVEAVGVMPSGAGCHTLGTRIREAKPNISDGRTCRYTFAASFNAAEPDEKATDCTKKLAKIFHNY